MKPQDLILLVFLIFLIWKNNKNWTTISGIILLIFSIPLFAKYVFFTAEHFVYFAALYFFVAVIQAIFAVRLKRI